MNHRPIRFALNHMVAPQLPLPEFFALARSLDMPSVEIRNDILGKAILDGTSASTVRKWSADEGVDIVSINALQKFNHWSADRAGEAEALADYAAECGAKALVLVAANDGTRMADAERVANATESLIGLKPILASRGLGGFVECLGFEDCSLRRKSEAVSAIRAADGAGVFTLTHDTFHHQLAGEAAIFPEWTGLVHISGVDDPAVAVSDMRDAHRLLVGPADRLANLDQIAALQAAGCDAILSFEPFAEELRGLADPATAIRKSADYVIEGLARRAA